MDNGYVSQEGNCSVVSATEEHAKHIAKNIRRVDEIECNCFGYSPYDSMMLGLENDRVTLTGLSPNGTPFVMFGAGNNENGAYIWALGTTEVVKYKYQFLKSSRKWVSRLCEPFQLVHNFVHQENELAIKWLKFCGATILRKLDINSHPFFEFVIIPKK